MTDRDRLIEILHKAEDICDSTLDCDTCKYVLTGSCKTVLIADYLLANGCIVPPCKVGDIVYTLCGERYFDNNGFEWERLSGKQHIEERQFSLGMMDENYNLHSAYFLTKEEAEEKLKELGK